MTIDAYGRFCDRKPIGTQAVSINGFLVLYPLEDGVHIDKIRAAYGLPPMAEQMRRLQRIYGKPVVKARQAPPSDVSKQLKDSLAQAIESSGVNAPEIDPGDVIKVETSVVNLNVSVFNGKLKAFVGSLNKDDFRVFEDGHEENVTFFASTDVPFDLVLLIDLSGSTADKRDLIKQSTLRFIETARPNDRLAIVTFSDTATVLCPLTLDRNQLMASVRNMEGQGGSHIWDALAFALDQVVGPRTLERRRAVVLMSDGFDGALVPFGPPRGSQIMFADLLEKVRQTDTLVVPIYLDTSHDFPTGTMDDAFRNARRTMRVLAEESGGSYYEARKLSDLNGVYEQVINDLGKVYSLGYKPSNATRDGSWRSVEVTVRDRPDLITRARPGYYAQ